MKKRILIVPAMLGFSLLYQAGCSTAPPQHPPLSPVVAEQLLRYNTRAANHLKYIQSQDKTCEYKLALPDQSNHPTSVEVDHIAFCSGRNDLKQFDARVEFQWNKTENKWEIVHFGS